MKVSLSWLKELVDYKDSPKELADKLSLISIGVKEFSDNSIELDLTYNRGDLLSLRGVAREVAAITGSKLKFDELSLDNILPYVQRNVSKTPVQIEDEKLSALQCVAKIEGLKVEKSPDNWVKKLNLSGMRSVNNITDVTNLIMLEYGQPLHAFDEATVTQDTINVRLAKEEEEITTLDGKLRKLEPEDIVLADTEKPLDVAGVMGGKDTEISKSSSTILLSASLFNPIMVRNTSKRLGLYSEASKRFQHGLTKTNLLQAFSAAIKMYENLGGKLTAISLIGDSEDKPKTITLTQKKLNSLIGIDTSVDLVESSLQSLGFRLTKVRPSGSDLQGRTLGTWEVTVPYWRLDIEIEEDLIEEVARMYGYEKIPARELNGERPEKLDQTAPNFIYNLKVSLAKIGLTEVQTYSFFSERVISNFHPPVGGPVSKLVKIANPISSETEYMRDQLWPNLIEVVARNLKQGYKQSLLSGESKDIAIFEVGKVYLPKKGRSPEEKYHLAIVIMNGGDNPMAELKVISRGVKLAHTGYVQRNSNLFHPTRQTDNMAEVHPRILNKFGIEKRVAIMEVGFN